jgi:hypothetical protein
MAAGSGEVRALPSVAVAIRCVAVTGVHVICIGGQVSARQIANVLNGHALEGRILLLCRRSKRQLFFVRQWLMDTVLLLELSY